MKAIHYHRVRAALRRNGIKFEASVAGNAGSAVINAAGQRQLVDSRPCNIHPAGASAMAWCENPPLCLSLRMSLIVRAERAPARHAVGASLSEGFGLTVPIPPAPPLDLCGQLQGACVLRRLAAFVLAPSLAACGPRRLAG